MSGIKSQIIPKLGLWIKLNIPSINNVGFIDDELSEDKYIELLSLNMQLELLYQQLGQLTSFRYSLRFPEGDYKYFKNEVKPGASLYWALESKRYKKLNKKFKKDSDSKNQLYA